MRRYCIEVTSEGFCEGTVPRRVYALGAYLDYRYETPGGNGIKNFLLRNSYFHHNHMNLFIGATHNVTIENNLFEWDIDDIPGGSAQENGMKSYNPKNLTIRNNIWKDISGSGAIWFSPGQQLVIPPDPVIENVHIYGNIFYNPTPGKLGTDVGTISIADNRNDSVLNDAIRNFYVYNNDFVSLHGGLRSGIRAEHQFNGFGEITDFVVYNNLFYDVDTDDFRDRFYDHVTDRSHNWYYDLFLGVGSAVKNEDSWLASTESDSQLGFENPLVDWQAGDFRLKESTEPGIQFPWMNNRDMFNNTRGADGVWDRGAIEYAN